MKKLVYESLFEVYDAQGNWSSNFAGTDKMPPEEFEQLIQDLVDQDLPVEDAVPELKAIFDEYPYMHEELGEVEGRDLYKKGIDIFIQKYAEHFNLA